MLGLISSPLPAQEAAGTADCAGFEWNMSAELALFKTTAHGVSASAEPASAASLAPDVLYAIALLPQASVAFVATPASRRVVDEPSGGLATFQVPRAGHYRISADGPVWIDVIGPNAAIPATAFNGHARCALIHKSVDFELPAGVRLVMQFSQSPRAQVRVASTAAPAARP